MVVVYERRPRQYFTVLLPPVAGPLASGSTDSTNTGTVNVVGHEIVTVEVFFTGVSGATGNVTFYLGESLDGSNFSGDNNVLYSPIQVVCTANGANTVRNTAKIDCRGIVALKLQAVVNNSGGNITNYGVRVGFFR